MKTGRLIKFPTEASRRSTREVYAEPLNQGARFSARSAYRRAA